jgi:hypothetical protein
MKTRFFLEQNSATISGAVRTKTILVSGQPVRLYSLDGKTWLSKGKIYAEFKRRRAREKETFQKWFRHAALELPVIHSFFFLRIDSILLT